MAYYIRKGNKVFRQRDVALGNEWTEITSTTARMVVSVFTTRNDAQEYLKHINDSEAVVSNNLEFDTH